ncbi:hypothetical protein SAMN02910275_02487 [Butyrivibrio sp. INlla18]|uniref:hypothetical protein n=1 Tax=Butyrivibrio sp. INlla18 TaxID=1520806 RepID=UPI00088E980A|nr:hypothetical protein [Butyrivibrio sp. INlla18]SDA73479.1 hypothetical protein SAMN02910275_02487 [Butyrivibrio sp. INlla18]
MYLKKIRNGLLVLVLVLATIILGGILAFLGYSIDGNDHPLYVIGFAGAIIIAVFGWVIALAGELIALINVVRTQKINAPLPTRYIVFLVIEVAFTLAWMIYSFVIFQISMSV